MSYFGLFCIETSTCVFLSMLVRGRVSRVFLCGSAGRTPESAPHRRQISWGSAGRTPETAPHRREISWGRAGLKQ